MAGDAVIGALRVVLGADTASLDKGLKGSQASLAAFASTVATGMAVAAAAVASTAAVIGYAIKSSIDEADKMGKMSQSIGVPVEELSKLKLAAELSDVSLEALGKSTVKLSKAIIESANNGTGPASQAFTAMGISVRNTDGTLKSSAVVMDEVAGKFATYEDGAAKTALAVQLFGKAGASMIPLLNSGKAGLKDAAEEAEKLGLVITTKTAKASEGFNDNMTRLGMAGTGVANIINSRLAPSLEEWSNAAVDVLKNSGAIQSVAEGLSTAIGYVGAAAIEAGGYLVAAWEAGSAGASGIIKIATAVGSVISTAFGVAVKWVQDLAQSFSTGVQNSTLFIKVSQALTAAFEMLSNGAAIVGSIFKTVWDAVAGVAGAVLSIVKGQFQAAWDTLKNGSGAVGDSIKTATGEVQAAWKAMGDGAAAAGKTLATATVVAGTFLTGMTTAASASEAAAKKIPAPWQAAADAQKNAFDQFIASQQKSQAAQQAEFQATGMAAGAKERLKVVLQGLAVAQANGIALTEAQRIKLTETANAAELMALKLGNVALLGETNPFAAIGLQIDATNLKLQQGGLDAQNYAVLSGQAAQLSAKLWADSATSLAGSFESVGSSLSQMNEGWARAAKIGQAIGAAVAFVNSYVAASQAFATTPFPANIAIAAGVLAKGIAMVAAIKGAAMPTGMMTGGSMMVHGGGGPDSVPVNMMLSPGEQVDVWRPDEGGGRDPRGGKSSVNVVNLSMPIATTREALRDLIEGLNAMFSDGYVLKVQPA